MFKEYALIKYISDKFPLLTVIDSYHEPTFALLTFLPGDDISVLFRGEGVEMFNKHNLTVTPHKSYNTDKTLFALNTPAYITKTTPEKLKENFNNTNPTLTVEGIYPIKSHTSTKSKVLKLIFQTPQDANTAMDQGFILLSMMFTPDRLNILSMCDYFWCF